MLQPSSLQEGRECVSGDTPDTPALEGKVPRLHTPLLKETASGALSNFPLQLASSKNVRAWKSWTTLIYTLCLEM